MARNFEPAPAALAEALVSGFREMDEVFGPVRPTPQAPVPEPPKRLSEEHRQKIARGVALHRARQKERKLKEEKQEAKQKTEPPPPPAFKENAQSFFLGRVSMTAGRTVDKRALQKLLEQAAANTAKLPTED